MSFNNQISKFFNIDAPVSVGGSDIASLMARHGTVNNDSVGISEPINVTPTEKQDEPAPATEPVPAATATSSSPAEPAKSEPPATTEPELATTPQIAAEPPKVPSLQEVLKNQQPDTVLKELGYDDNLVKFLSGLKDVDPKVVNFLNLWKEGKDLTGYLKEWTTDYGKMSAEDVMRHQLQKDYPTASPQQLEALYKREVIKAYSLDSDDDSEAQEGKLLLDAKADRYRETLIQGQKDFLFPKAPEPKAPVQDLAAQEATEVFEAIEQRISSHTAISNLYKDQAVFVGEGDDKFKFPVTDAKDIVGGLLDVLSTFVSAGKINKDSLGRLNDDYIQDQLLIGAFSRNPKQFLSEYAKHFKSIGGKSAIEPIENASKPDNSSASPAEAAPKSPAEAMARGGRLVS